MPPALGVAAALSAEARLFRAWHPDGETPVPLQPGLLLLVTGVGAERARAGARRLLAGGASALLSFGFAAGLAPALPPGTLLMPRRILDTAGRAYAVDDRLRERLGKVAPARSCADGPLAETLHPLWQSSDKAALRRSSGAVAADMESAALARVAGEASIPFAVLRVVIDPAERDLPACARAALGGDGAVQLTALLAALLRRPWELWALLRLADDFRAARSTLAGAAAALGREAAR